MLFFHRRIGQYMRHKSTLFLFFHNQSLSAHNQSLYSISAKTTDTSTAPTKSSTWTSLPEPTDNPGISSLPRRIQVKIWLRLMGVLFISPSKPPTEISIIGTFKSIHTRPIQTLRREMHVFQTPLVETGSHVSVSMSEVSI